jgi:hypothetical protein
MGLLVFRGCDEALGRFDLIHGSVAAIARTPRLRLVRRSFAYRPRGALCVHQWTTLGVFRSFEAIAYHLRRCA